MPAGPHGKSSIVLERRARAALAPLLLCATAIAAAAGGARAGQAPPSEGVRRESFPEPLEADGGVEPVFIKDTRGEQELVVFSGNVLFNDFTYRSVLQLPKGAAATPKTAQQVTVQLMRFLKKAGYDLAQVTAAVDHAVIRVTIDEGRLDKVVITGESALNTIRLRLQLALPADVFNRPELEERLRALSRQMGLTDASYQLVRTQERPETKFLLEKSDAYAELLQAGLVSEPGVYELRISIRQSGWGKGFSPEVVIGGLDGDGVGGTFRGARLLPVDDRWELRLRLGATTLPSLDGMSSQLVLSRALAEIHYWAPPLLGQSFRPGLLLSSDLLEQARRDIGYDLFRRETLQAAAGVSDAIGARIFLAAGVGVQSRWFFDLDDATQMLSPLHPEIDRQVRPFFLGTLRLLLDPEELRADFRNPASVTAQVFKSGGTSGVAYRIDAGIDYAQPIGWHELRFDAHAFALGGDTQFFDQETLGDYMQNVFNDVFSAHVVELGCEFRYSLLRDRFKVGALAHVLAYGELNALPGLAEQGAYAVSLGVGVHTLAWDTLNVDADVSAGYRAGGKTGVAFSLNLTQVY